MVPPVLAQPTPPLYLSGEAKARFPVHLSSARLLLFSSPPPLESHPPIYSDPCFQGRSGTPPFSAISRWTFILDAVSPPLCPSTTLDERRQIRPPTHLSGVCPLPRSTVRPLTAFMITIHTPLLCRTLDICPIRSFLLPTPTTPNPTSPSRPSLPFSQRMIDCSSRSSGRPTAVFAPRPPIPPSFTNTISPAPRRRH